jgi:hypothetical protein
MRLIICRDSTVKAIAEAVAQNPGGGLLVACEYPVGPCPELSGLPVGVNRNTLSALAAPAVDAWLARLLENEGIPVLYLRDPVSGVPDGANMELSVGKSAIVEKETGRTVGLTRVSAEYMIHLARRRGAK